MAQIRTMAKIIPGLYGLSAKHIAAVCHVDLATARRWKRGTTCPPPAALMVLRGDLGCFDPAWAGWTVRGEMIHSPEGWQATMADIRSLPLLRSAVTAYRVENRQLKEALAEVEFVDEQPLPHEISLEILAQIK